MNWTVINWNAREYLNSLHTKQLLKLLDSCRAVGGEYSVFYPRDTIVTTEQIKAELAAREHVPNKIEAKALRQQTAKEKRNR